MSYDEFDIEFQKIWIKHIAQNRESLKMGAVYLDFLAKTRPDIAEKLVKVSSNISEKVEIGRGIETFVSSMWDEVSNDNDSRNPM